MRKRDWIVIAALALCVLGLVACGGGGSSSASGGNEEEEALGFTECLRAHGVEVEDPKPGQKNIELPSGRGATAKRALHACNGKLGDSGQELSASEGEEFREGWLAFARCVRAHGVDMGDPEFQGNGKVLLDTEGIDTSSPAFEAARQACQGKTLEPRGISIGG